MRTKLAPKKQRELFLAKVKELLLSLGAQQEDEHFILQTKVGKLTLYLSENKVEGLGIVFTRFDDPQAAQQIVACNPFSGKWNHFYFDGWTVETAIDDLATRLKKVL